MSTVGPERKDSMSTRASFRNTSAQLLRISFAFLGVIRNSDCQRAVPVLETSTTYS